MAALDADVVVVGAGPGGCAAGLAALRVRRDARVLLLDRAPCGRDKVCGDPVGPRARQTLAALGAGTGVRHEEEVSRFRLVSASGRSVSGAVSTPGFVVLRRILDARLLDAAVAAGAQFHRATVAAVPTGASDVVVTLRGGGTVRAAVVIGADGANSVVRCSIGEPPSRDAHLALAVRGYADRPQDLRELLIRWHPVAHGIAYAWAFPTADGHMNVGYGAPVSAVTGGRKQLESAFALLLENVLDTSGVRFTGHHLPLSPGRPRAASGRVLLVGDAAGLVNPLSGEGIFYALESGRLAGAAALSSRPDTGYREHLAQRFGRHHRDTAFAARLLRPVSVEATIHAARNDDPVLRQILDLALGDGSLSARDIVRFTRSWIAPRRRTP
ncbi:MAG: geranylgeranyl reductase family protein [Actinobacteria bacterium]|nr:geranylgeranyl reductase family protein [Actinomycetota bacterium]